MSKKKSSTEQRLRRELEILRAQVKSEERQVGNVYGLRNAAVTPLSGASAATGAGNVELSASETNDKAIRHSLPVAEIKIDLVKTFLFAMFALGLIFVIRISNLDLVRALHL